MKSFLVTLAATSIALTSAASALVPKTHTVTPQGETYHYYWNPLEKEEFKYTYWENKNTEENYQIIFVDNIDLKLWSDNKITSVDQINNIQIKSSSNRALPPVVSWGDNINNGDRMSLPVDEAFNPTSVTKKISGDLGDFSAKALYDGAQYSIMDWTIKNSQGIQLHAKVNFGFYINDEPGNNVSLIAWAVLMTQTSQVTSLQGLSILPLGQQVQIDFNR